MDSCVSIVRGQASHLLHLLILKGAWRAPIKRVSCWHNPDMPTPLLNVRYRARSGKHLLAASISALDPKRKLASRNGASGRVQCRSSSGAEYHTFIRKEDRTPRGSIERFEAT